MAEPPVRRTVLRDYFGDRGLARTSALADYRGEAERHGLAYRIGDRLVRSNNELVASITGLPAQLRDDWALLKDPEQRRLLARALVDDSLLTTRRRKAIFSLLLWGSLLLWVCVGIVVAAVNRDALATYQSVYALFFYSLATSLFLPTPFEILLGNAVEELDVFWTVLVASVAKVVGSWLVLLMGDKANEGLRQMLERHETLAHLFRRLEAFAQRFGYFAVFVLFAIPFMSDTAPLFVLAVLNMRKGVFLAVTFVAIVVRSLLFIYAGGLFSSLF